MARVSAVLDAEDPKALEGGRECEAEERAPMHALDFERSWTPRRSRRLAMARPPCAQDRPEPGVIHRLESILRPGFPAQDEERPRLLAVARRRALGR